MASVEEHLAKAQYNQVVADTFAGSGFYDWAISALFYAALNLMQAYLLEIGMDATTHIRRRQALLSRPELEPIVEPYAVLQLRSEAARYDCKEFTLVDYEQTRRGIYTTLVEYVRQLRGTS